MTNGPSLHFCAQHCIMTAKINSYVHNINHTLHTVNVHIVFSFIMSAVYVHLPQGSPSELQSQLDKSRHPKTNLITKYSPSKPYKHRTHFLTYNI